MYICNTLLFRYSDLLALVEDIVDLKATRVLRGLPGRRAAAAAAASSHHTGSSKPSKNKKLITDDSDTESDSSEVNWQLSYLP